MFLPPPPGALLYLGVAPLLFQLYAPHCRPRWLGQRRCQCAGQGGKRTENQAYGRSSNETSNRDFCVAESLSHDLFPFAMPVVFT